MFQERDEDDEDDEDLSTALYILHVAFRKSDLDEVILIPRSPFPSWSALTRQSDSYVPYIYVPHKVCDEVPATLLQCSFNSPNPQFSALVETSKYERSTCLIGLILKHCRQGLREGETIRCLARLARLSFYWLTNIAPIAQLPSRFSTFYFPRNQLDFIIQHNRSYLGYLCHVQLNRRSRDTALLGIMYEKWNLRQVKMLIF
ncbi:hypothetical protein F4815DRAFT_456620 [Daldinia loculata]|nr:hypothetical protein F4815DRAFT_456620 [Daldinia loculata]